MRELTDTEKVVRGRLLVDGQGRQIRTRAGLSLSEVAQIVGVGKDRLSVWERGLQRPRGRHAVAWFNAVEEIRSALRAADRERVSA